MRYPSIITALVFSMLLASTICASKAAAQVPAASPSPSPPATPTQMDTKPSAISEADPTRPMLFVIRNEYRDLRNGGWADTTVIRHDRFSFRNLYLKGGGRGFVLRFDIPLPIVHSRTTTKAGLGDIYVQALFIPRISRRFALSVGSGLIIPTATSDMLGQGKLIVAPVIVPLWYLAGRRRLVTLRFQHYISVAGKSSRPDVNFTVTDPSVGWALGKRSWIFTDTELKWDWRSKMASGITAVQFGRMVAERTGFWIKPEIPWGPGRVGGFNIKVGLFRFR